MTFGSLFSGIGGMDLGLERAGMECKWQVENNEYCLKVLSKHWPAIPKYADITALDFATVEPVDLLAGGFPCQDLSVAGKQAGLRVGNRSGLWFEFLRGIRALRPRFVLVENVPGLLTHYAMGRVLGDLAECGYDAEWSNLSACSMGAPHTRERVWILGYSNVIGAQSRLPIRVEAQEPTYGNRSENQAWSPRSEEIAIKTSLARIPHGIPHRVDRIRGLGNACVPQVVEWIGRKILESQRAQ